MLDTLPRFSTQPTVSDAEWVKKCEAAFEGQVYLCELWIEKFLKPTKTIRRLRNSYGYKHDVERWSERIDPIPSISHLSGDPWLKAGRIYIPEPAFTEAMIRQGYKAKKSRDFNYSFFNATRRTMARGQLR